jgi:hypothetical protein
MTDDDNEHSDHNSKKFLSNLKYTVMTHLPTCPVGTRLGFISSMGRLDDGTIYMNLIGYGEYIGCFLPNETDDFEEAFDVGPFNKLDEHLRCILERNEQPVPIFRLDTGHLLWLWQAGDGWHHESFVRNLAHELAESGHIVNKVHVEEHTKEVKNEIEIEEALSSVNVWNVDPGKGFGEQTN